MKILERPFSDYLKTVQAGLIVILLVAIARFLILPLTGTPYAQGSTYTSVTLILLVAWLFYTIRAVRTPGTTYRDLLGMSAALALPTALMIIVAILIDDFAGIQTYYTDIEHGGQLDTLQHSFGHLVVGLVFTLILWGVSSLIHFISSRLSRPQSA